MKVFTFFTLSLLLGLYPPTTPDKPKPTQDIEALKRRCLQGNSRSCYLVYNVMERKCALSFPQNDFQAGQCLADNLQWYVKGVYLDNQDSKYRCLQGDTAAYSLLSGIVKDSLSRRLQTNDPSLQIAISTVCLCWLNVGISQGMLKDFEATKGKNSPEYNEAKTRVDAILKMNDTCMPVVTRIF